MFILIYDLVFLILLHLLLFLSIYNITVVLSGEADTRAEVISAMGGVLFAAGMFGFYAHVTPVEGRELDRFLRLFGTVLILAPRLAEAFLWVQGRVHVKTKPHYSVEVEVKPIKERTVRKKK